MTSQLSNVLPYGLGVATFLLVVVFLAKTYFTELVKAAAARTPGTAHRLLIRARPVGGRKLRRYRRMVLDRYSKHRLGFGEGTEGQPIDIRAVYVPLQYVADNRRADVYHQLGAERRTVLLGEPGAGKSLLLKNAMVHWAEKEDDQRIPVMVDLHQCNTSEARLEELVTAEFQLAKVRNAPDLVERALEDGRLRVYFDGLDEVGSDAQDRVVRALQNFATRYSDCQTVVTCRNAAYREQLDEQFDQVLRLADFDDAAVIRFLDKWPGIDGPVAVGRIFRALQADPELMGLARSPLMLTMIAYLQSGERAASVGPLPNSRAAFYDTAVTHLLDRDRRLGRSKSIWLYTAQRKMLVLERIARNQLEAGTQNGDRQEIAGARLEGVVREMLPGFDLGPEHTEPLLNEIVQRSQLVKPLDRINRLYAFTHLTLLEYLAARALAAEPQRLLEHYRRAPDAWRETVRMWCAVAQTDCTPVIREVFAAGELRHRVLALQCLAEVVHIDEALAEEILTYFLGRLGTSGHDGLAVAEGLGALAASSRPRGTRVRDSLIAGVAGPPSPARSGILTALAASGRLEAADALAACARRPEEVEARAALQSMGEIAVPALAAAARTHAVWAVHSLGAIGTPAAAQQLALLLWGTGDLIAHPAAWTLASLLRNPTVEEGLRGLALPEGPAHSRTYGTLWHPFAAAEPPNSALPTVAGRIAALMDAGHLDGSELPSWDPAGAASGVTAVDPRIGIPMAAIGAGRSWQRINPGQWARLAALASEAAAALSIRHPLQRTVDVAELLGSEAAAAPDSAALLGPLKAELLAMRGVPEVYQHVLDLLPWPVQARLLAGCLAPKSMAPTRADREPVTWDSWKSVRDNPPAPRWWERLTWTFSLLTTALVLGLGGLRTVSTLLGWHPFGLAPMSEPWFAVVLLTATAGLLGLFAILIADPDWLPVSSDTLGATLVLGTVATVTGLLGVAATTFARLGGWPATVLLALALTIAIWLPAWVASRRNRARANPLRPCLEAGEALRGAS